MKIKNKQVWKRRYEENSERRFVPWFNMAEWDQVYKQLYSDDTTTQMKGFERLLLWKARCPQGIPAGAQCTIDLIQICLKDRELWPKIVDGSLPQYRELELQLMYSVAILRFLNHFTPLVKSNPNDSLYDIAKKVHIPDWVVNIRHETAHSQNLPSLNILREATNFCLDWIHEHYWKNEAELTTDLILDGKPTEGNDLVINLKNVVEIWQAIMLYSKAGVLTYKDIPDEQLRKQLLDKRLNYDTNEIKQLKKKLQAEGHIVEDSEIEEAQLVILKELADYLEMCDDPEEACSLLVDILLEGDGFLASSDFMSVFNTEYDKWRLQNDTLPVHFINLWKTVFDSIQQGKVIPLLLKKLIALTNVESENCNRCRMAALWIKELSQSLFKTKKAGELKEKLLADKDYLHKVKKSFFGKPSKGKLQRKVTSSNIHRMMIEKIEDQYSDLKQIMTLKIQKLPNSLTQMELLGEAIKKPNKWTNIFLPYLMDLVEPPLSEDGRQKLITLVNIYTQEQLLPNDDKKTESPIYTVDNLENPMPVENKENSVVEEVEIEVEDPCMVKFVADSLARDSIWIRYEDDINWSRCPIGRLPWQDSGSPLNIDFPCETTWQPLHKTDDNYEKTLPGFFHEKINWDEILRKRPRRSRNLQEVHPNIGVVDKAVSVALIKSN